MTQRQTSHPEDYCNSIAYHVTDFIQPHYVMLVLRPGDFIIERASENAATLFGLAAPCLLDRSCCDVLPAKAVEDVLSRVGGEDERWVAQIDLPRLGCQTDAVFFRAGSQICVEIEKPPPKVPNHHDLLLLFSTFAGQLSNYSAHSATMASAACEMIQRLIGFDRVYFCEFDAEGNGYVSGEYRTGALPSLLHHHFPHTDIPASLRPIYVKNKFRCIPNIHAQPVRVIGHGEPGAATALDLSHSVSRQPGSTHLEYLANMGVQASASFSVVRDGRLAGIFGGHSIEPRQPLYWQLALCQQIVRLFLNRHALLELREQQDLYDAREAVMFGLLRALEATDFDFDGFLRQSGAALCELMDADGLIGRFEGVDYSTLPLTEGQQREVVDFIAARLNGLDLFMTDGMTRLDEHFRPLSDLLSGVLAVATDEQGSNLLAWTRGEQLFDEKWSGNPAEAVRIDQNGRIGPRQSFDTWVRQVSGRCRPWNAASRKLARSFKDRLNQLLATRYYKLSAEYANRASAHKSELLANMSHELRTPMHTIMGFVEAMVTKYDTMPDAKKRRYLELVQGSSERLLRLVNNLLDLAKLEAGAMQLVLGEGDLLEVIQTSTEETEGLLGKKALRVDIEAGDCPTKFTFDRGKLIQVFVNLLSNAAKFSPESGRITVRLEITGENRPARLLIEVADEGVGIPGDQLETVFDKFVQSSRTHGGAGGTGLGLSICREIVDLHRGRIWARNNPSGGASFFVELPYRPPENSPAEE